MKNYLIYAILCTFLGQSGHATTIKLSQAQKNKYGQMAKFSVERKSSSKNLKYGQMAKFSVERKSSSKNLIDNENLPKNPTQKNTKLQGLYNNLEDFLKKIEHIETINNASDLKKFINEGENLYNRYNEEFYILKDKYKDLTSNKQTQKEAKLIEAEADNEAQKIQRRLLDFIKKVPQDMLSQKFIEDGKDDIQTILKELKELAERKLQSIVKNEYAEQEKKIPHTILTEKEFNKKYETLEKELLNAGREYCSKEDVKNKTASQQEFLLGFVYRPVYKKDYEDFSKIARENWHVLQKMKSAEIKEKIDEGYRLHDFYDKLCNKLEKDDQSLKVLNLSQTGRAQIINEIKNTIIPNLKSSCELIKDFI